MQAVYAVLGRARPFTVLSSPFFSKTALAVLLAAVGFYQDGDGRKAQWRNAYRDRLAELTTRAADLAPSDTPPAWARHPAYADAAVKRAMIAAASRVPAVNKSLPGWRRLRLGDGVAEWEAPFVTASFGAVAYSCSAKPVVLADPVLADSRSVRTNQKGILFWPFVAFPESG